MLYIYLDNVNNGGATKLKLINKEKGKLILIIEN